MKMLEQTFKKIRDWISFPPTLHKLSSFLIKLNEFSLKDLEMEMDNIEQRVTEMMELYEKNEPDSRLEDHDQVMDVINVVKVWLSDGGVMVGW
jgi:hypothetical protein